MIYNYNDSKITLSEVFANLSDSMLKHYTNPSDKQEQDRLALSIYHLVRIYYRRHNLKRFYFKEEDLDSFLWLATAELYETFSKKKRVSHYNYLKSIDKILVYIHKTELLTSGQYDNFMENPRLTYAVLRMSGIDPDKDSESELQQIVDDSVYKELPIEKLLDYSMDKWCVFNSDTKLYKYIKISVMMSIARNKIQLYEKLDSQYKVIVQLVFNCYMKHYMQYREEGVIRLNES